MNQALAFGLLFGGGVMLTSALTGSSPGDVLQGKIGTVSTTGDQLTVGGVGQALSGALGNAAGFVFPFPKGAPGVAAPNAWSPDQGVDISAPAGTPELAVGSGTIVQEGIGGFGPYAPILKLDTPILSPQGPLQYVYYGHSGPDLVPVGAHVAAGQPITEVGAGRVGISTGPHLELGLSPTQGIPRRGETSGTALSVLKGAFGG